MKNKFLKTGMVATLVTTMLFTGCGKNPSATLVTIDKGKDTISLGYADFTARYTQSMYDGIYLNYFGETMWSQEEDGKTMEDTVKENVLGTLEETYLLRKHAADYDVKISDKDKKAIQKAAKAFIEANDKETLKEMSATQEIVEQYLTDSTYATRVEEAIRAEAKVEVSQEEAAQKTIYYVKLSTAPQQDGEGNTTEKTDEEIEEIKKQAQALSEAENFESYAEENEWEILKNSYGKDNATLDDAVIAAADKLEEGQISAPILVKDDGYYVVRLDSALDKEATENRKEELEEEQRTKYYTDTLDGWKEEIDWKVDEKLWAKVTFDSLFETITPEEDK